MTTSYSPQIFKGASSSSRMGCERKISRDFKHNPRISDSVSWTFFPGLEPRTKNKHSASTWMENASVKKWKIRGPGVGFLLCLSPHHFRESMHHSNANIYNRASALQQHNSQQINTFQKSRYDIIDVEKFDIRHVCLRRNWKMRGWKKVTENIFHFCASIRANFTPTSTDHFNWGPYVCV